MPSHLGFNIWIEVDGDRLQEYGLFRCSGNGGVDTMTCWVPCETGKDFRFVVCAPEQPRRCNYALAFKMDGKRIEGIGKKTIRMSNPEGGLGCPRYYEGQYDLEGDGRLRPFQFARLVRTDDDGVPEEAQPGLGDLVVSIYTYEDITEGKWDVAVRRAYKETLSKPLEGAVVHERAKRKMESCIKFGEPRDTAAAPVLGQENPLDGNEKMGYRNARKIGDVVFKYRSMDILLAEGIARRPDPTLEAVQGGGSSIPFSLPLPLLSQLAESSSSSAAALGSMGKPGDPRLKPPQRKDTHNVEAPKIASSSPSSSKLGPPPSEASTSGVRNINPPDYRASRTQSGSRSGSSLSAVPPPLSSTPELRRSESINANTNSSVPLSPPRRVESGKIKRSKLPSALSSPPPKPTVVKSESVVKKEEEPESSDDLEEMSMAELNALKARAAALEELAAANALIADIEARKRKRRSESSARPLDSKPVKEEARATVFPPSGEVIDLTDLDMEAKKRKRRSESSAKLLESKRVKKERKTEANFLPGEVIDLT